ncbi:siderophore-interacting protein [Nocardiopsis oceani]
MRPAETLRTYTVRDLEPDRGEFELWVHLFEGEGIGLHWARTVAVGDQVRLWGPQGEPGLRREAAFHLFVGEETGACAFPPLLAALGPDAHTIGVLESDSAGDDVPVSGLDRVVRVHRHGASAAASRFLPAAVAELDLPEGPGFAYVAGEARTGQAVRAHLVGERGWPRDTVRVKAFWASGKGVCTTDLPPNLGRTCFGPSRIRYCSDTVQLCGVCHVLHVHMRPIVAISSDMGHISHQRLANVHNRRIMAI